MADVNYIMCGNKEELFRAFASEVRKGYYNFLDFWANALKYSEPKTVELCLTKMQDEPQIVEECVYQKIKQIVQNRKKNKHYYKKYLIFRSHSIITISEKNGFYEDLLNGASISHAFLFDTPYSINLKKCTIEKEERKEELTF